MFLRNQHLQIFLIALVCVHFVCPLFCAAYTQNLCSNMQAERAETDSSCCSKVKTTDATNNGNTPSESGTACCLTDLELILPTDTNNIETVRESAVQHPISKVQLSAILSVSQEQLLNLPGPPKLLEASLNTVISHRGPPFNRS